MMRLLVSVSLLALGCNTDFEGKSAAPTGVDPPTEEEVEDYITNGALDLAPGTTLGGASVATEDDLAGLDWTDLGGVPEDLLDGDDDTLAVLSCAEGEWPSMAGGTWSCTATLPPERVDAATGSDGDVLMVTAGTAAWVPIEEAFGSAGCPAGTIQTGDTCVESAARPALTWRDAVLACATDSLHLCTHAELLPGCVAGSTTPASTGLEWTADRTGNGQAAMAFDQDYDCEATTESIGNQREYRCCTGAR